MRYLSKWSIASAALLTCMASFAESSVGRGPAPYSVLAGDQNGDGCDDYLVKAQEASAPSPGSPSNSSFALLSGAGCSYRLAQGGALSTLAGDARSSVWKDAPYQVEMGDVRGDGGGSWFLVPVASSALPTFNVVRDPVTGTLSLLQVLKSNEFRIGTPGVTVSLELTNPDTRTDLVLRRGNDILGAYAAGPDGAFAATDKANLIALSHAVWNAFMSCASRNNVDCVLATMSMNFRSEARSQFGDHPSDLPGFAAMVTKLDVVEIQKGYTSAALILTVDGKPQMHIVHFSEDFDGSWKISDM